MMYTSKADEMALVGHQSCGHCVCDGYKTAGLQLIYIIAAVQGVPIDFYYLNISVFSIQLFDPLCLKVLNMCELIE